jgi:quercetin dioxygenase-like cupin family protein
MNGTKGLVIPPGGGTHLDMSAPGRFSALKLLGRETNESVMLFEETVPAGTKSLFHLHHDSDEVAWVLAGEITFKIGDDVSVGGPGTCAFFPRDVPHAWKNTGRETARVLFLYTPAAAGGYVEALLQRRGPMNDDERRELRERYRWEIVGPNPLGRIGTGWPAALERSDSPAARPPPAPGPSPSRTAAAHAPRDIGTRPPPARPPRQTPVRRHLRRRRQSNAGSTRARA